MTTVEILWVITAVLFLVAVGAGLVIERTIERNK